ncbi:uncharacterized protein [Rutidosis leptorrhynchoides]|uniref:uncharacterized protein n=1 Tax=Rutidosis leptorrhynchoides TaxID=125765 RepID=UPI003A99C5B8
MGKLIEEQKRAYDKIAAAAESDRGGVYFVYGYGGTGKTFLWRSLAAAFRSNPLAELIVKVKLIIWDEAHMTHKHCFEAVDRTLWDLMRFKRADSLRKPFGGRRSFLEEISGRFYMWFQGVRGTK